MTLATIDKLTDDVNDASRTFALNIRNSCGNVQAVLDAADSYVKSATDFLAARRNDGSVDVNAVTSSEEALVSAVATMGEADEHCKSKAD